MTIYTKHIETLILNIFVILLSFCHVGEVIAEKTEHLFNEGDFILVEGGCYSMGCESINCDTHEKPIHEVCVDTFMLEKFEVTNKQFVSFLNAKSTELELIDTNIFLDGNEIYSWGHENVSENNKLEWVKNKFIARKASENHPADYVSWSGAKEFVRWLSQNDGKNFRLPTEAEWEYACRGHDNFSNLSRDYLNTVSWNSKNSWQDSEFTLHNVGEKKPNSLGLYDMLGNAQEWVEDIFDPNAYSLHVKQNPVLSTPISEKFQGRVTRGGSVNFIYPECGKRENNSLGGMFNKGFRVAYDDKPNNISTNKSISVLKKNNDWGRQIYTASLNNKLLKNVEKRNSQKVEQLLRKGADPNAFSGKLIHEAVFRNDVETLTLLLNSGGKTEEIKWGYTPLMKASDLGSTDMVSILLEKGANISAQDKNYGTTSLWEAVNKGHSEVVRILLNNGADPNHKLLYYNGRRKWSPLLNACFRRQNDIIKMLINHGANPNYTDDSGNTALSLLLEKNSGLMIEGNIILESHNPSVEMAKYLIENGANPIVKGKKVLLSK